METPSAKSDAGKKAKRTRNNVRQSKYGCLTCKYEPSNRRSRPSAADNMPGNDEVSCLGYPIGAPSGPLQGNSSSALVPAPAQNPNISLGHYAALACTVLSQGPRRAKGVSEVALWNFTVPQMVHSIPSVRAAAAAFGASYDEYMLKSDRTRTGLVTIRQYHQALQAVQNEVSNPQHETVPCMVACLLMAFTEVLQQRSDRAFVHLQGAFAIMASRSNRNSKTVVEDEDLSAMFEKLTLHTATYTLSRALDPNPQQSDSPKPMSLPLDRYLSQELHSSYQFIRAALPYKYANPKLIPSALGLEQGRHLGNLRQWLLDYQPDPSLPKLEPQNEQLFVLRAQCLAGLVQVATVLQPYEIAYDSHEPDFQEIIASVEAVLDIRAKDAQLHLYALPSFTPEMGIIQPLFQTALKCRHPFWRRKALSLLQRSGREGPWSGPRDARVLEVVMAAEEAQSPDSDEGKLEQPVIHNASGITEHQRIHQCWVVDYLDRRHQSITHDQGAGSPAQFAKVQLSKHLELDAIMSDETRGSCGDNWLEQEYWQTWYEIVPLPD
ncbi:hypothetical protein NW762_012716 [Fusarium torreyae]|uniref:Uncharacterized protein n=1 Tax=Fusarium torreyae TaxID=1237075 RepID=A0A9W8VB09_9HYPO|nr:hypothetical protein NW762_012716 [Fusarium torreyae]